MILFKELKQTAVQEKKKKVNANTPSVKCA